MTVRPIQESDALAAAELSTELGYPVNPENMCERIRRASLDDRRAVFVAADGEEVAVGWIDVSIAAHLQGEPYGEIGGLVVSSTCRSQGVGKLLLSRAEQWIAAHGVQRALVRSQVMRESAHRFYLREGYERTKTSAVFSKQVAE